MPILETGYRISDLNAIPTTGIECAQKNKIALDETYMFFISQISPCYKCVLCMNNKKLYSIVKNIIEITIKFP